MTTQTAELHEIKPLLDEAVRAGRIDPEVAAVVTRLADEVREARQRSATLNAAGYQVMEKIQQVSRAVQESMDLKMNQIEQLQKELDAAIGTAQNHQERMAFLKDVVRILMRCSDAHPGKVGPGPSGGDHR